MRRRAFIQSSAAASVPLFDIVPARALGLQGPPPSDTIALGHIGIGGRGRQFLRPEADFGKQLPANPNLGGDGTRIQANARSVALCDIDSKRLDEAATRVGGRPKMYRDFRKLLDDKSIDAVVIASPHH